VLFIGNAAERLVQSAGRLVAQLSRYPSLGAAELAAYCQQLGDELAPKAAAMEPTRDSDFIDEE